MSDEAIAQIRGFYARFSAGDFDGALEWTDPEIEWVDLPELPGAGTHHGHEAVKRFFRDLTEGFETWTFAPEAIEAGPHETYVVQVHVDTVGRGSGVALEFRFVQVLWRRDGKFVTSRSFMDVEQARREAGIEA